MCRCEQVGPHMKNESLYCCIAGLLRCGQTCLQRGWWQTLCKSLHSLYISSDLQLKFRPTSPLNFHQASHCLYCLDRRALQDLPSAIHFFFFASTSATSCEFHPLKLHQLPWKKPGNQTGFYCHLKVHPRLYYLSSKRRCCCFVYQVAALTSVHEGKSGYVLSCWGHFRCFHQGDLFL